MNILFENKKVLVIGLARSGVSSAKYLAKQGASVIVTDSKSEDKLSDQIDSLNEYEKITYILGRDPKWCEIKDINFAVISPGVPLDLEYVKEISDNGIEVISEIELAYRAGTEKNIDFLAITGTNGKTTTTAIVGEIMKAAQNETYVVGNIGTPAIEAVEDCSSGAVFVTEVSSFQLESTRDFKPFVSAVLNLTEDHLNRHHTMENYANAKSMIFKNQDSSCFCVLNYDDDYTRLMKYGNNANVLYFSRKNKVANGVYLDDDNGIVFTAGGEEEYIMNASELSLPGSHNLENSMAAIAISIAYEVDVDLIRNVLKSFKAVEHRMEFVEEIDGVKYINDSKGTNPDSTIKAVTSYNEPIILIAGGYDKGSDFKELMDIAKPHLKSLIVLGQTRDQIVKEAMESGIEDIHVVESISDAVKLSAKISSSGDIVLLSPACASWDMYSSYEERGRDFKNCVRSHLEKR